jgi:hypothetical protein
MKPAVFGKAIVLAGALALTANAYADAAQARARSAPPSSGPAPTAVQRSAPPPSAPPARAAAPAPRSSPPPQSARTAERSSSDSGRGRPVAVPRGSAARGGTAAEPVKSGAPESAVAAGDARQRHAPATRGADGGPAPRAVERGDRSRDGRSVTGVAVPRTRPPYWNGGGHGHGHGGGWYYPPSYWWGYTGVGLGYFYYDPLWWGPSYYGYGYPGYGYGYPGYAYGGSYGAYGGSYGGNGGNSEAYYGVGQLRLKVKPRDAEVFVDGYFSGVVDDYDGTFQRLTIDSGPHKIEIRKPGFTTLAFDVRIPPDETVTYKGKLEPEQP